MVDGRDMQVCIYRVLVQACTTCKELELLPGGRLLGKPVMQNGGFIGRGTRLVTDIVTTQAVCQGETGKSGRHTFRGADLRPLAILSQPSSCTYCRYSAGVKSITDLDS